MQERIAKRLAELRTEFEAGEKMLADTECVLRGEPGVFARLRLRGVRFNWREEATERFGLSGGREIGLIGQEVEKVVPEVVATDGDGMKSVEYSHLVAILIEAVKELEERCRGLECRLAEAT